jgi:hypothetical protein
VDLVSLTVQPEPTNSPSLGLLSYRADGDAKASAGLYDVQRGAPCFPRADVEGNTFCVPQFGYFLAAFSDSGCSKPIEGLHYEYTCARTGGVVPTAFYLPHDKTVGRTLGLGALVDVHEFGTVTKETRYTLTDGKCVLHTLGSGDGIEVFRVGKLLSTYAPPRLKERVDQ